MQTHAACSPRTSWWQVCHYTCLVANNDGIARKGFQIQAPSIVWGDITGNNDVQCTSDRDSYSAWQARNHWVDQFCQKESPFNPWEGREHTPIPFVLQVRSHWLLLYSIGYWYRRVCAVASVCYNFLPPLREDTYGYHGTQQIRFNTLVQTLGRTVGMLLSMCGGLIITNWSRTSVPAQVVWSSLHCNWVT